MAIKVIKRGNLPEEKVYQVTCYNCKSLLELTRQDATYHVDQCDGDYLQIQCPVCGHAETCGV